MKIILNETMTEYVKKAEAKNNLLKRFLDVYTAETASATNF